MRGRATRDSRPAPFWTPPATASPAAARVGSPPFRGPVVTLQPSEEVGVLTRSGTRDGLEGGHGVCKDAVAPSIAVDEERGLTKSVLQQRMSGVQGSSFNTGNVRMVLRCYFGPKFVPDDDSPASRQCGMQLPDCTANKVKYPIEAVSHVRMLFVYRESQKQSGGLPADHAGFLEVLHNQLLQVTAADLVDKEPPDAASTSAVSTTGGNVLVEFPEWTQVWEDFRKRPQHQCKVCSIQKKKGVSMR
ncbi:hypothetical protein PC129_g8153 [Phytophthora cactorum]|uniref:Uncharacterized protein n=1 Tax=Phytophthora cactorum TaxID=29920 RepID=A0A8T1I9G3_9STRA|nr:hypothetical protein PC129_g8153 [Phytophthora cactorum]